MKKVGLFTLLFVMLGVTGTLAQDSTDYIRFTSGITENDGSLEVKVETWETPQGQLIDLYGVIHIADKAYYEKVQKELDAYDAVLYEGVGATKEVLQERRLNKRPSSGLSNFQKAFGKLLDLQFQLDGIAYTSSNLVHADMGMDEFSQKVDKKDLNPLEEFMSKEQFEAIKPVLEWGEKILEVYMQSKPEIRNRLKITFASQMTKNDVGAQLPPDLYKSIVLDRNKIVMGVLAKQLSQYPNKKRLAIFYGAAHMPDFSTRFQALGYKKKESRWMTAWKIGQGTK